MNYRRVLFVCTGNTCRSPMAEAILENMLEKETAPRFAGISVKSAGTIGLGQCQTTDEAIRVMWEKGLDIGQHRPRHIDGILVDWADVILVMELGHKQYVLEHFPHAAQKVHLLTEFAGEKGEVADPFSRELLAYHQCRDELEALLDKVMRRKMT